MTAAARLARFVATRSWNDLSGAAREELKIRVLDALGCALGALDAPPTRAVRAQLADFGGRPLCTLIGGGRTAPDRAALYNGALVRYLDFNDSYFAPGETCHPSDNLAPVLAAAEYADASGRELLTALAVAYQVQCRLSDEAPVRAKGFDHTTQGSYAAAAGAAKALRLGEPETGNALAIAGTALNALRVTRTGELSQWKGLAYPFAAFGAVEAVFLAARGVSGPPEVFEGNKGFMDSIAGPFEIDWEAENLERVRQTFLKRYNAEIHSQSALEALLELSDEHAIDPNVVERIELETFQVAYDIIGGGEEGGKKQIETKEQADHSLPYLLAVALLDGQVLPAQFMPERILRPDVQQLLRRVEVRPAADLTARFPAEHACRLRLRLAGGVTLATEKSDYHGFLTRPMSWEHARQKFERLAAGAVEPELAAELAETIWALDELQTRDLTAILERARRARNDERSSSMTSTETRSETHERAFAFLRLNERPPKPRSRGVTEIRGPYYTPVGRRYLEDLLETMGAYVDTLKYAGGSFALMPREAVRALNEVCHEHAVEVSTGGFLEYVLTQRGDAVEQYLKECRELGFDIVEISSGFVTLPVEDLVRLTTVVREAGLKPKPEVGIQFGAGGTSSVEALEAEGTRDVGYAIELAKRHLDAGAHMIMIESEGITEQVREWRTDVVARIVSELGLEQVMFEAAEPDVFSWYIKNYGIDVNLFVDHSQIVQLEGLRAGIWGTQDTWGRMLSYRD